MTANQAAFSSQTMAQTLGVSRGGYLARRDCPSSERAQADARPTDQIEAIHEASEQSYGAPRIHAELTDEEVRAGRKRVERPMKAAGLTGVSRRKGHHEPLVDVRTFQRI
ncbi:MAG: IS3 family transposase [Caulobacterales bacterium]|nr:IS3 family transposase [Caulobacterales bacterium]